MKRKPNPQKVDRENPAWTKETFARARNARDVLPEIFGAGPAAKMRKPRGRPKSLGAIGSPGHQPGQLAWGHFLAISPERNLIVADVLNWRFQVFVPKKASGKLSEYIPTERQLFGFKQSVGYVFHLPGWPMK
jgi:CubicO group peptidase (beta-lactamase class C family)